MTSLRTSALAIAALAVLLAGGCKDGTGPERPTPREVQKVAGDDQQAVRGDAIPLPMRVRVVGSDGRPLSGAAVQWAVSSDQATLDVTRSVTNAAGEAEARVTVVRAIGSFEVTATAAGVTPATFDVEGLDPCLFAHAPTLPFAGSRPGTLSALDCSGGQWLSDVYVFSLAQQEAVVMSVRAPTFDPWIAFYPRATNWYLSWTDTVNATRNARIKAILPVGDYAVEASSYAPNMTGAYEVALSPVPESAEGCELVVVMPGIRTSQQFAATDCTTNGVAAGDRFLLVLVRGEKVRITQTSAAFAPRLKVTRLSGLVIAESQGPGNGTAVIDFTGDEALGGYFVSASSTVAGETGAYELAIGPLLSPTAQRSGNSTVGDVQASRQLWRGLDAPLFGIRQR